MVLILKNTFHFLLELNLLNCLTVKQSYLNDHRNFELNTNNNNRVCTSITIYTKQATVIRYNQNIIKNTFFNKSYHLPSSRQQQWQSLSRSNSWLSFFLVADCGDKDCTTDSVLVAVTLTVLEVSVSGT